MLNLDSLWHAGTNPKLSISITQESRYFSAESVNDLRLNRKKYLDTAMKEIKALQDKNGQQIVKGLDYIYHMAGRKIKSIEFTFQPFKADLQNGLSAAPNHSKPKFKLEQLTSDAQQIIDYFNFFWRVDWKKELLRDRAAFYYMQLEDEPLVQFNREDAATLKLLSEALKNGESLTDMMQVVEMKAIEWLYYLQQEKELKKNFVPSVVFGKKYSEYRAMLELFKAENKDKFVWDTSLHFGF